MTLEKITHHQSNKGLIAEMYELIAPSYASTGKHILHDIELCGELYTIREASGQLAAFFMVGYHTLGNRSCYYLGLSACREDFKGQRSVSRLYHSFLADCRAREAAHSEGILLYGTTVRPEVFSWLTKILVHPCPGA